MNKTILLTGVGKGIGRGAAFALAKRGHKVIATTHTEEKAADLKADATSKNIDLEIFVLDITKEEDRNKIKGYDLDVLINVAGIGTTGPLAEVPMEKLRAIFETNVFGTIEISQLALIEMTKKNRGTVIIVSSLAGRIPLTFFSPYAMSKFALSGGAAAMRNEVHQVAPNVHVSLIEPGSYNTGFNKEMIDDKYNWIKESSPYYKIFDKLKTQDKGFRLMERQSTASIVKKVVKAAEAKKPRLRYSAPWYMSWGAQILRILGR